MTTNAHVRQPDDSTPANSLRPARKVSAVVIGLWRFVRLLRRHWRWFYFLPNSAERDLRAKTLRELRTDDFGRAVAKNLNAFYPCKPNAEVSHDQNVKSQPPKVP